MHQILELVESSYATRRSIEKSLREIDRRALNAMVLVKRHGSALAGYGVVAGAFREGAARLQISAQHLQDAIGPLVYAHMRILQHRHHADALQKVMESQSVGGVCPALLCAQKQWDAVIATANKDAQTCLNRLLERVIDFQEGLSEQQYVVLNGHIEAALSEMIDAPLKRVSRDMETAVTTVHTAVWTYRSQLEKFFNENRSRF